MFQDNPLLAQLKQKLHDQTLRVEGVVKATDKTFGFLDADNQKTYFIPPLQMKKLMHGDRISAAVQFHNGKEVAEPESLLDAGLTRFIGQIQKKDQRLYVNVDNSFIKDPILCRPVPELTHEFNEGDWVVAELRNHPLVKGAVFTAEITEFITDIQDTFAPWWIALSRHQLEKSAPHLTTEATINDNIERTDLTALPFFTIDNISTEDMDDALYLEKTAHDQIKLHIAIADPCAYIAENSELDTIAQQRAFTNYLPGLNIPMLPRELSDTLCSLQPNERRPALVCSVTLNHDGSLANDMTFQNSWIISHAKLDYHQVSDWLENTGSWQPDDERIATQLHLLENVTQLRAEWRKQNALVFKERTEYRFVLDEQANVQEIKIEPRRIANRMIEEAMIVANICAAEQLKNAPGFGLFTTHNGFDANKQAQLLAALKDCEIDIGDLDVSTMAGFIALRHKITQMDSAYLDARFRRYLAYVEFATQPAPHFGLGLPCYATWTSPIRKYGDMVNQRLLKSLASTTKPDVELQPPTEQTILQLMDRRRLNRYAEKELSDGLYCRYLQAHTQPEQHFPAEVTDIMRGGMRARLLENGAMVFIPATFIHKTRDEITCHPEQGIIKVKGDIVYKQADAITVQIVEIRVDSRNIIAKPVVA